MRAPRSGLWLLLAGLLVSGASGQTTTQTSTAPVPVVELQVVRALDPRLPGPTDADLAEIVAEARRVVDAKLGRLVRLEFKIGPSVPLEQFFASVNYRSSERWDEISAFKYDLQLGAAGRMFTDAQAWKTRAEVLRNFKLEELAGFFPGKTATTYEEVARLLVDELHRKVAWLRTLETAAGEPLLLVPGAPWQSETDWECFMRAQRSWDVVVTNTLVLADATYAIHPHAIMKHGKIGGSANPSPARDAMDGSALVLNVIEEFGGVKELGGQSAKSHSERNKLVGAVLLAHELGHAYFGIPDVYDHGDACLMNTSAHNLKYDDAYRSLLADFTPCAKCQRWVEARALHIRARQAAAAGDAKSASALYRQAVERSPAVFSMSRVERIGRLCREALAFHLQQKDEAGAELYRRALAKLAGSK